MPVPSVLWRQEEHLTSKKTELGGASVVICLERGADLYAAQLMPLPLTVSCFSKVQIAFTFLILAHPCSPGKRAVKQTVSKHCRLLSRTLMSLA